MSKMYQRLVFVLSEPLSLYSPQPMTEQILFR